MKNKRYLAVILLLLTYTANAQDFVSLFMEECKNDSTIDCITISPRMMEEILKSGTDKNDNIVDIITKLKSMQILTSSADGEGYYHKALDTFERSSGRYERLSSFNRGNEDYTIFVRKRKDSIVEMTMMLFRNNKFAVINFTGDNIEPGFISTLARSVSQKQF